MTEVSIIVLALAIIIERFNQGKLMFRVKELEETVESHWSAIQHECNAIWSNIIEEDEDEGDGTEANEAPDM